MRILYIKLFFYLLWSSFGQVYAFQLKVNNELESSRQMEFIQETFQKANQLFEKNFGNSDEIIEMKLTGQNCFRTGYNYQENMIIFCSRGDVVNAGLDSIDVVNHELFHAFFCSKFNSYCQLLDTNLNDSSKKIPVHEGAADYFAYLLNPDQCFGEKFYKDKKCVREYITTYVLGYVEEEHAVGNVLVSQMIKNKVALKDVIDFFESYRDIDAVEENLRGREKSKTNRYRLSVGEKLEIKFSFADQNLVQKIKWEYEDGNVLVDEFAHHSFSIELKKFNMVTHLNAVFLNEDNEVIGYRRYYLGRKLER